MRSLRKEQTIKKPAPLPSKRERALSNSFDPKQKTPPAASLLGLPYELRLMIYTEVLGGDKVALLRREQKIVVAELLSWEDMGILKRETPGWGGSTRGYDPEESNLVRRRTQDKLCFLRTCRQVYVEGIDLLYSTNEFGIEELSTLHHFKAAILPKQFQNIASLSVLWDWGNGTNGPWSEYPSARFMVTELPPYDMRTWLIFWEMVRQEMVGLRVLRLDLKDDNMGNQLLHRLDAYWVQPVLKLRGLKEVKFSTWKEKSPAGWYRCKSMKFQDELRKVLLAPKDQ
jgi:hypothetical protein